MTPNASTLNIFTLCGIMFYTSSLLTRLKFTISSFQFEASWKYFSFQMNLEFIDPLPDCKATDLNGTNGKNVFIVVVVVVVTVVKGSVVSSSVTVS